MAAGGCGCAAAAVVCTLLVSCDAAVCGAARLLRAARVVRCRSLCCRWSGGGRRCHAMPQFVPPRVSYAPPASCVAAEWMPRVAYALPASRGIARRTAKTPHIGSGELGDYLIYGDVARIW